MRRVFGSFIALALLIGVGAIGVLIRDRWTPSVPASDPRSSTSAASEATETTGKIILSDLAIDNLGLKAKSAQPTTFWKTIRVPGMVVDRPGRSDRGIVSPATGVIVRIDHFPGETLRPGETLFAIRLLSDSLHLSQSELFKATQDITIAQAHRERLKMAPGAIPEARIIEVDNQITRLEISVKAYRQELLVRGMSPEQIEVVAQGQFVNEIEVRVPALTEAKNDQLLAAGATIPIADFSDERTLPTFELQELKVDLGQQVQTGQTLCLISNHQLLAVEGRAFPDETALLEKSIKEKWPVDVDFQEVNLVDWPALDQTFYIRYLSNTIDPANRTFAFLMPLENQSRVVDHDNHTQILWRFRPGQKVRVLVRIEKLDNVFFLPSEALARGDGDAFVFTQNVNTFERKPVRVVYQDRQHAVVANDGSLLPGIFVVQNGAAQLNRMANSHSSDTPKGYHIHADGSLHKNEDEAK